jgi:UDP-glucuronate 4-epimerase
VQALEDLYKNHNRNKNFTFFRKNLKDINFLEHIFKKKKITHVIHLAAQAGVRYSLINPFSYVDNNLVSFHNILFMSKKYKVKHLIYASTRSVYGDETKSPFKESFVTDFPIQFYAATKKSNEVMAHSYSAMYKLRTTGLRFFTVYGPWGRPDMALFKFTKNILNGKPIQVFNKGKHARDFTYVDDIVDGITKTLFKLKDKKLFHIFNLGNGKKEKLTTYINYIEDYLGLKAKKLLLPMQMGDIAETFASTTKIKHKLGYSSKTDIKTGIKSFLDWYLEFYKHKKKIYLLYGNKKLLKKN